MFGKLFGAKPAEKKVSEADAKNAAMLDAIRARSKEDPLIGAKIGAKEVVERLLTAMRDERGIHAESLLCAAGALAGYACQASLRAQTFANGKSAATELVTVETTGGKRYFFGDPLNRAVAEDRLSVWGIAGGAAEHLGVKEFFDVHEVFQHTAAVIGTSEFGVPRLPANHQTSALPAVYLKALWPALFPTVKLLCPNPAHWHVLYSLAVQDLIFYVKDAIDPALAFRIVMESAIPMSKIDLPNA
jgi:hypothetical protein